MLEKKITLESLFIQARMTKKSVHIELSDEESVIFKGIKIIKNEDGIKIYSTGSEFYNQIYDISNFLYGGFEYGVYMYLEYKYKNQLDKIELGVQSEISSRRNHKKIKWLKGLRENLIKKYNETKRRIEQIERRQTLLR